MQSRWRSKAAWSVTLAFILFFVKTYLKIEVTEADKLVEGIIAVATVWGIFNNPVNKGGF
jgi:hypothetical protein